MVISDFYFTIYCSTIFDICRFVARTLRYHNAMFKCLYDRVENECNATASVIYTTYELKKWQPLLSTANCTVSE